MNSIKKIVETFSKSLGHVYDIENNPYYVEILLLRFGDFIVSEELRDKIRGVADFAKYILDNFDEIDIYSFVEGELRSKSSVLSELIFLLENSGGSIHTILSSVSGRYLQVEKPLVFEVLLALGVFSYRGDRFFYFDKNKFKDIIIDPAVFLKRNIEYILEREIFQYLDSFLETLSYNISVNSSLLDNLSGSSIVLFEYVDGLNKKTISLPFEVHESGLSVTISFNNVIECMNGLNSMNSYDFTARSSFLNKDVMISISEEGVILNPGIEAGDFFFQYNLNSNGFSLGREDMSSIVIGGLYFGISLNIEEQSYYGFNIKSQNSRLVIASPNSDGLLSSVLPPKGLEIEFGFSIGWSNQNGFYFSGSATLDTVLPINRKVGPVAVNNIGLLVGINVSEPTVFEIKAGISFNLGPVLATVDQIGVHVGIEPKIGGNLGIVDLEGPRFLPPTKVGIRVNAPLLTGGGFLNFDHENGRYSGALALKLEKNEINAVAIITTKNPDGSKGFSMLVAMNMLFNPTIQLSFGFTLSGVGGIIGINRTMNLDALTERFRNGAIGSLMFPEKVIENADQIISDLEGIFPTQKDHFVVAPFVRLGWGTPNIVTADLGVLIEIPFKDRIILLGTFKAILPDPQKAIVKLVIDVIGDFNFAEKYISILGRLRDSSVAGFPLTGEFGFRLEWGSQPQFMLSVGGYHPDYKKPESFPELARLQIDLSKGKNLQMYGRCYQAITSNSIQFGAEIEMHLKVGPFKADGDYSFHALYILSPRFEFSIRLAFKIDVAWGKNRIAGAELNFQLTGPEPFHAVGYANLSLWKLEKSFDFDESWGGAQEVEELQISDLHAQLKVALSEDSSWGAILPEASQGGVRLKEIDDDQMLIVHPAGRLEVRQNLVPLNKTVERLGRNRLENPEKFIIEALTVGGEPVKHEQSKEYFARSQFEEMSQEEKISAPDFELMDAGFSFGSDKVIFSNDTETQKVGDYEDILLDKKLVTTRNEVFLGKDAYFQGGRHLLKSFAPRKNGASWREVKRKERFKGMDLDTKYQIQEEEELNPGKGKGNLFTTFHEAKENLRTQKDKKARVVRSLVATVKK